MKQKQTKLLGVLLLCWIFTPAILWADANDINGVEISVATLAELEAAIVDANAGDTILLAEGTYTISSSLEIKSGVTYQGAGSGKTIIDGGGLARAFVGWGDRAATNGQVDANGVGLINETGSFLYHPIEPDMIARLNADHIINRNVIQLNFIF